MALLIDLKLSITYRCTAVHAFLARFIRAVSLVAETNVESLLT